MTSCLLVKAPDRLVAVADGRLSVGETAISFETTRKIVRVVPRYRVPYVSVGRFSHYGDHLGREVFVAYAGAYALIAEILNVFRSRITERLILVWRDGAPVLSESFDRSAQFLDDYDFRPEERPDIDPRLLLEELRAAIQEKADEWCRNRALRAECEFLLFGKDKANAYFAYRVSIDPAWSPGGAVRVLADPIGDGELAAIGSADVLGAAFGDPELTRAWKAGASIRSGLASTGSSPAWTNMTTLRALQGRHPSRTPRTGLPMTSSPASAGTSGTAAIGAWGASS
ncbi:MAG: hypothetical protein EPO51_24555 [Phenylobacterium sp.]|uniref:hypothetical protein n=1 Tax=Phenylobacterium sp. TaxID=1871053 RepID=UPI0012122317|nr:hypothetical protein [Phenylobacterium sp.]TAJ68716.1 MAG: hypothetical protein EPO51_24555 [Phenylobacterium sp.]